jgi:hypothetical protein
MVISNGQILNHIIKKSKINNDVKNDDIASIGGIVYLEPSSTKLIWYIFLIRKLLKAVL